MRAPVVPQGNSPSSRSAPGRYWPALIDRHDVSEGARYLYTVLSVYADAGGEAWPSVSTLARRLGVDLRTVHRRLDELVANGCLKRTPRASPAKPQPTTLYRLLVSTSRATGSDSSATTATTQASGASATTASSSGSDADATTTQSRRWRQRRSGSGTSVAQVVAPAPTEDSSEDSSEQDVLFEYDATAVAARVERSPRAGQRADQKTHGELVGLYRDRCTQLTAGEPVFEGDVVRVAAAVKRLLVAGKSTGTIALAVTRAAELNQPGLVTRYVGDIEREAAGNGSTMHRPRRRTAGDGLADLRREIEQSERAAT